MAEFAWSQPVGGKSITWAPLTVGQEIDIEMAHQRAELAPLRKYEVIRRRITNYDGKQVCTMDDLKSWDPLDLEMFVQEVEVKEDMRRAALASKSAANQPSPAVALEAALLEMRSAAGQFMVAADRALAAAKVAGPLGSAAP